MKKEPWRVRADRIGVLMLLAASLTVVIVPMLQGRPKEGLESALAMIGGVIGASIIQALWRLFRRKQTSGKDRPVQ